MVVLPIHCFRVILSSASCGASLWGQREIVASFHFVSGPTQSRDLIYITIDITCYSYATVCMYIFSGYRDCFMLYFILGVAPYMTFMLESRTKAD